MTKGGWPPLASPAAIVGVLAAALLALAGLVALDQTEFIVPPPETEAVLFFKALKAHNYENARDHLAPGLQEQVTAEDLRELGRQLDETAGGIEDAHGLEASEQAGAAVARVSVKTGDGQEQELTVPLQQDQGVWKITSLDPLLGLTGAGGP
jgi:hypothetical protein